MRGSKSRRHHLPLPAVGEGQGEGERHTDHSFPSPKPSPPRGQGGGGERAFFALTSCVWVSDPVYLDFAAFFLASVDTVQNTDNLQGLFSGHGRGSAVYDCLGKFYTFLGVRFKTVREER